MLNDVVNAFYPPNFVPIEPFDSGPLIPLSFSVKDNIDVKGYKTTAGSNFWMETHEVADQNAWIVEQLLLSGARCIGKNITDALAFSYLGTNQCFGSPINPVSPDRHTGGSSCGSAAAVAAGLVDFSIGTDTGGSIRIPASFCRLFGIRPTFGAIAQEGVVPLASSFDTIGWLAKEASTFKKISRAILSQTESVTFKNIVLLYSELYEKITPLNSIFSSLRKLLKEMGYEYRIAYLPSNMLKSMNECFIKITCYEAWQNHQPWLEKYNPILPKETEKNFLLGKSIKQRTYQVLLHSREKIRGTIKDKLGEDEVALIPTTVGIAPKLETSHEFSPSYFAQLSSLASVLGFPEVTVPFFEHLSCPVGLSFIGPSGCDTSLTEYAANFYEKFNSEEGLNENHRKV